MAMTTGLNDDFSLRVALDSAAMPWQPSPGPKVWRKRLEHRGALEQGRVTSVVRFDADSRFAHHPHPDGEEILVLDGTFSDHTGDYPAGSFLLNPEGFEHAPFSHQGCRLFVKLRQMPGLDRRHVTLHAEALPWHPTGRAGVETKLLYEQDGYPERIRLMRLAAGASMPVGEHDGAEAFVIAGACSDGTRRFGEGFWLRYPPGHVASLASDDGCTLYLKTGHLADA